MIIEHLELWFMLLACSSSTVTIRVRIQLKSTIFMLKIFQDWPLYQLYSSTPILGFESRTCFEHVQTFWTRLSPPKSFSRFLHFGKTFSIGLEWVSLGSTTKWRFITWRFVRCGFIWFSVTRWLYYYSIFGHLQNDKLPSNIKMTKLEQHFDKNHPQKLPKDF